ncbi:PAS domain-containing protein [Flavobacterium sp. D11R37]|uniref:sensor histidine kinase n=1 Tax=Flavobacterium coralii TaxID=2838017 RepID=UPI001CA6B492|nr:PAS domain-containing sensor histidine kinase [Flavobacterium coralii]MBY8962704.1 PAS domain-containing protein [Flavobacterium coralii]
MENRPDIEKMSFQYVEQLANMGHWKLDLSNNTTEFSDNLYRLFGYEPGEIDFTGDDVLKLIHPDDLHIYLDASETTAKGIDIEDIRYRIITPDGKQRYLKSVSKLLECKEKKVLMGVTCDISSQVSGLMKIEEKNRELEQLVDELASFNYAVSHDLQEPLRKIIMYISRIEDQELKVPASVAEYLERITVAAKRMKLLINDLLLYSQTNKDEHVFAPVNLAVPLREAINELSVQSEAKQAKIHFDVLPILPIIPFQVRQLFVNLLNNSLKYSRADAPPVIDITCTLQDDIEVQGNVHTGAYYEISVKDNGIGFKQEFSEKLFLLFHRLHQKERYEGTGIGLAICKKIMENHKGFITAEGNQGQGSIFRLYFPA